MDTLFNLPHLRCFVAAFRSAKERHQWQSRNPRCFVAGPARFEKVWSNEQFFVVYEFATELEAKTAESRNRNARWAVRDSNRRTESDMKDRAGRIKWAAFQEERRQTRGRIAKLERDEVI